MPKRIIHIEDYEGYRDSIQSCLEEHEYIGAPSLEDLEGLLKGPQADLYLIDGSFPRYRDPPRAEYLAPEAIEMIRTRYPMARIILLTGDSELGSETAAEKDVIYLNKAQGPILEIRALLE